MLILAIDTSGKHGSIALARGDHVAGANNVEIIQVVPLVGGTFSAQLVPQIATLLSGHGFSKHDVGAFAAASGPGSFTGLRVGLAAVKALAEVLGKPIAAVSLLEACAITSGVHGEIVAALDAGRNEAYIGEFNIPLAPDHPVRECLLTRTEFIAQMRGKKIVTPDPLLAELAAEAGFSASLIAPLSAAAVARLGWHKIRLGEAVTPDELEANYIRRTGAETRERIGS